LTGTVNTERVGAHVLVAELDNPPRNILQSGMVSRLDSLLSEIDSDRDIRVLVVAGKGRAFCVGADLRGGPGGGPARLTEDTAGIAPMLSKLESTRVPVVALVNGACVGGGLELALRCDIRLASTEARFVAAGVNVGLVASADRLPRLIGVAAAKAMLLTGDAIDAQTALRFNLVTAVHPPGALRDAGLVLAERIASGAPLAVAAAKRIATRSPDLTAEQGTLAVRAEAEALAKTADHAEAVRAFLDKRTPQFEGR